MIQKSARTVPQHVGYIVDGNRRWAKKHGLPSYEGHLAGYDALKQVVFKTFEAGVDYVSIYAFSTENWKRGEGETGGLMKLALRGFKHDMGQLVERGIRVKILGTEDGLDAKVIRAGRDAEEKTAHLSKGTLCICFNYGGQQEIVDAARAAVTAGVTPDELTIENFERYLYAPEIPTVDVIVRTSGEQRLSNFMLWRSAYSEFIFLDKLWPDMREADVYEILDEYQKRGRRFGS